MISLIMLVVFVAICVYIYRSTKVPVSLLTATGGGSNETDEDGVVDQQ